MVRPHSGKRVRIRRSTFTQGLVAGAVSHALSNFVSENRLGVVVAGGSGIYLERSPDTVRGSPLYFLTAARRPSKSEQNGYLAVAPELCVEIVSPKDRWSDVAKKVDQYVAIGVKM